MTDKRSEKDQQEPIPKNPKKRFPWMALLAVLSTLGLVAAIALPSMFAKIRKSRQLEAVETIAALNRAQQAYFRKKNTFADSIEQLGLRIKPEGKWYRFQMLPSSENDPFQLRSGRLFPPEGRERVLLVALAKESNLKNYTGTVFAVKINGKPATVAAICETQKPSSTPPEMPSLSGEGSGEITCPACSVLYQRQPPDFL